MTQLDIAERLKPAQWWKSLTGAQSVRTAAAIGWASRGVMAVSQIGAIRLLTSNLGVSGYAAYAVIIGLQFWFTLSDFGFGASLQNRLTHQRLKGASGDETLAVTVLFLTMAGVILCGLIAAMAPFAGPALLRKIPGIAPAEAAAAFGAFGVIMIFGTVSSLANRAFYAEHKAHLVYMLTAAGNLAGFALLSFLPLFRLDRPLVLAIVLYNSPAMVIAVAILSRRLRPVLRNQISLQRIARSWRRVIGFLWKQARYLLLVTLVSACVLNVDYVILSQFAPPAEIASYAIVSKFFAFAMVLFNNITMASWPHFSEAVARNDAGKLRRAMRDCYFAGFFMISFTGAALGLLRHPLIEILSPHHVIAIPLAFVAASWFYWCIRIWTDTNNTVVLSAGRADLTSIMVIVQAVVSIVLQILGAKYYGITGLLIGLIASFLLTAAWYIPFVVHWKFLRQPPFKGA